MDPWGMYPSVSMYYIEPKPEKKSVFYLVDGSMTLVCKIHEYEKKRLWQMLVKLFHALLESPHIKRSVA